MKLTKEQQDELQTLIDSINEEAKKVVEDYSKNPSEISGSVIKIHEDSPFLDETPMVSGSRWKKIIKT